MSLIPPKPIQPHPDSKAGRTPENASAAETMADPRETPFDVLPVGYALVDAKGVVQRSNQLLSTWTDIPAREITGRAFSSLFDLADQPGIGEFLLSLTTVNEAGSEIREASLRGRTGFRRVQIAGKQEALQGEMSPLFHVTLTDISRLHERHRYLQEMTSEQEAFTHSISHDLRAPLITITNYSEYLANECTPPLEGTAREVLSRIQRAAQRMDDVLQNLLVYSRVGQAGMSFGAVDIGNIVTEILIQHHGVIQERRARIEVAAPLHVAHASRELLGQIIANLLTNALKYTEKDQEPHISFSSVQRDDQVVICVADNGIGIEPKYHQRIFQIFERLHGQTTYPGTGIGLAVVRRAIERMKGRIWVDSAPGKGSRFYVSLPRHASTAQVSEAGATDLAQQNSAEVRG